jgi:hypothetical protein
LAIVVVGFGRVVVVVASDVEDATTSVVVVDVGGSVSVVGASVGLVTAATRRGLSPFRSTIGVTAAASNTTTETMPGSTRRRHQS